MFNKNLGEMILWLIMVFFLAGSPQAQESLKMVGVLWSEYNAEKYQHIYQDLLLKQLEAKGIPYRLIGDREAADSDKLSRYPCIITANTYRLPEEVEKSLAEYVKKGGKLIWADGPVLLREDSPLREAFGVGKTANCYYGLNMKFVIEDKKHPITSRTQDFVLNSTAGNSFYGKDTKGKIIVKMKGKAKKPGEAPYEEVEIPAILVNRYGKGQTLLYNWIALLNREDANVLRLFTNGLKWLVPSYLFTKGQILVRPVINQTKLPVLPLSLSLPKEAEPIRVEVMLSDIEGKAIDSKALEFAFSPDELEVERAVNFKIKDFEDGTYKISAKAFQETQLLAEAENLFEVFAKKYMSKRKGKETEWTRKICRKFKGTLGDYDAEPRDSTGHVDIPRLIKMLKEANISTYDFLIWHSKYDWEDLHKFLPEAQKENIKVWVTLVPPSECPPLWGEWYSEPYRLNYITWAKELAKLSLRYPNLIAFVIDDFDGNALYTPEYIKKMMEVCHSINPELAFFPTIYYPTIERSKKGRNWMKDYGKYIDGIVFPYTPLDSTAELEGQLKEAKKFLGPNKLLLINVYAAPTSWHPQPPTPEYLRSALEISWKNSDGIRIYCLPKEPDNPLYQVTKEVYGHIAKSK